MRVDLNKYLSHDEETIKEKCKQLEIAYVDFNENFMRDMAAAQKVVDSLPESMKTEFFSDALKLTIMDLIDDSQFLQKKFVASLCEIHGIDL